MDSWFWILLDIVKKDLAYASALRHRVLLQLHYTLTTSKSFWDLAGTGLIYLEIL